MLKTVAIRNGEIIVECDRATVIGVVIVVGSGTFDEGVVDRPILYGKTKGVGTTKFCFEDLKNRAGGRIGMCAKCDRRDLETEITCRTDAGTGRTAHHSYCVHMICLGRQDRHHERSYHSNREKASPFHVTPPP